MILAIKINSERTFIFNLFHCLIHCDKFDLIEENIIASYENF